MALRIIGPFALLTTLVAACGCGEAPYHPVPYVPASSQRQPIICHDGIGHKPGSKPWILGGTCCCTPTRENYELHVRQGAIPASMSYQDYLALYREKGIVTDLDHRRCGGYCDYGPHVTLGGKCMATPAVGAKQYEQATFGPHKQTGDSVPSETE